MLVADLIGQITQVHARLGQPRERFRACVMVGLEAVSQVLEERQRLLQEALAQTFQPR